MQIHNCWERYSSTDKNRRCDSICKAGGRSRSPDIAKWELIYSLAKQVTFHSLCLLHFDGISLILLLQVGLSSFSLPVFFCSFVEYLKFSCKRELFKKKKYLKFSCLSRVKFITFSQRRRLFNWSLYFRACKVTCLTSTESINLAFIYFFLFIFFIKGNVITKPWKLDVTKHWCWFLCTLIVGWKMPKI
jgi:hypothetical protein